MAAQQAPPQGQRPILAPSQGVGASGNPRPPMGQMPNMGGMSLNPMGAMALGQPNMPRAMPPNMAPGMPPNMTAPGALGMPPMAQMMGIPPNMMTPNMMFGGKKRESII